MTKSKMPFYIIAVLVMTIWSITYPFTKVLLTKLGPVEIMFYRTVIAYAVMWIMHPKFHRPESLKTELLYAAAGIAGGTLYYLAQNFALNMTTACNVGLLVAMAPVLTAVLAHFTTHNEKLRPALLVGFVLAFAGSFLVIFNGAFKLELHLAGDLLAVGAALAWAVYSVILKRIGTAQNGIFVTRRIFFYSIITMIPALPLTGYRFNLAPLAEPSVLLNLLFLALLASCGGFLLWNRVIWALGAVKSSNFIYLSPAITLVSSAIVLGEAVTAWALGGMALILLGVYVAENAGRRKQEASALNTGGQ